MARVRMVTRTVSETIATVMCVDVTTGDTIIKDFNLASISEPTAVLKALKKSHETDTFKVVYVQSVRTEETLYGMTEADFIKAAKKLPPRSVSTEDEQE